MAWLCCRCIRASALTHRALSGLQHGAKGGGCHARLIGACRPHTGEDAPAAAAGAASGLRTSCCHISGLRAHRALPQHLSTCEQRAAGPLIRREVHLPNSDAECGDADHSDTLPCDRASCCSASTSSSCSSGSLKVSAAPSDAAPAEASACSSCVTDILSWAACSNLRPRAGSVEVRDYHATFTIVTLDNAAGL